MAGGGCGNRAIRQRCGTALRYQDELAAQAIKQNRQMCTRQARRFYLLLVASLTARPTNITAASLLSTCWASADCFR